MAKPHLACDLEEEKLRFPLIGMPKIDGVRGINLEGTIKQRTLKPLGNKLIEELFSGALFVGFDGELAVAGAETAWDLCRRSTSLVRSSKGGTDVEWHLFDYLHPHVASLGYQERLKALQEYVEKLQREWNGTPGVALLRVVPHTVLHSLEDFLNFENSCMEAGYEGVIVRDPFGKHKDGRATVKTGAYMRRKPFIDFEGEVVGFTEAKENQNEAVTNALGRSERSTHKENMVPKGMIGNIQKRVMQDVVYMDRTLLVKDQIVTVGPGEMPHEERIKFFNEPHLILGQIGKSKILAHGQKDNPRMGTWKCFRDAGDVVLEEA